MGMYTRFGVEVTMNKGFSQILTNGKQNEVYPRRIIQCMWVTDFDVSTGLYRLPVLVK